MSCATPSHANSSSGQRDVVEHRQLGGAADLVGQRGEHPLGERRIIASPGPPIPRVDGIPVVVVIVETIEPRVAEHIEAGPVARTRLPAARQTEDVVDVVHVHARLREHVRGVERGIAGDGAAREGALHHRPQRRIGDRNLDEDNVDARSSHAEQTADGVFGERHDVVETGGVQEQPVDVGRIDDPGIALPQGTDSVHQPSVGFHHTAAFVRSDCSARLATANVLPPPTIREGCTARQRQPSAARLSRRRRWALMFRAPAVTPTSYLRVVEKAVPIARDEALELPSDPADAARFLVRLKPSSTVMAELDEITSTDEYSDDCYSEGPIVSVGNTIDGEAWGWLPTWFEGGEAGYALVPCDIFHEATTVIEVEDEMGFVGAIVSASSQSFESPLATWTTRLPADTRSTCCTARSLDEVAVEAAARFFVFGSVDPTDASVKISASPAVSDAALGAAIATLYEPTAPDELRLEAAGRTWKLAGAEWVPA